MRLFETLHEAESEIRRDLAKGTPVVSSRVQQRTGLELKGRERLGYEYAIQNFGDIRDAGDLVVFAGDRGFPLYKKDPVGMLAWLVRETAARLDPETFRLIHKEPTELMNSALLSTLEGNHPSYTYTERLIGAIDSMELTLSRNPDSRRAFWPMFQPLDALRASEPTRVPCTLGYQPLIRQVGDRSELMMFYLERSCDFDNFWLSDVWFARQIQLNLCERLNILPGQLVHFIVSFHSFQVDDQEIY